MANHLAISPARFESECRALYRDLEPLLAGLSRRQFNWQPDEGRRWSIGQNLDHLTRTNAVYAEALQPAVGRGRPRAGREPGVPNAVAAWFIGQLEPPVRLHMKAPSQIVPAQDFEPAASRDAFDASVDRLKALLDEAWGVELSRKRFASPILWGLPVFNVAAGFLILLAHMRRHVAQAMAVRSRADFPVE